MPIKRILSSLICSLLPTLGVIYMQYFIVVEAQMNLTTTYWVSFASAIVGVVRNIVSWNNKLRLSIHSFNSHCLIVSTGLLAFGFPAHLTKWLKQEPWMTYFVIIHLIIGILGFITLWYLTYAAMDPKN